MIEVNNGDGRLIRPAAFSVSAGCEPASSCLCCPLLAGSSSPGQVMYGPAQWIRLYLSLLLLVFRLGSVHSSCWSPKEDVLLVVMIENFRKGNQSLETSCTPRPPHEPLTPPSPSSPSCDDCHSRSGPSAAAGSGW